MVCIDCGNSAFIVPVSRTKNVPRDQPSFY